MRVQKRLESVLEFHEMATREIYCHTFHAAIAGTGWWWQIIGLLLFCECAWHLLDRLSLGFRSNLLCDACDNGAVGIEDSLDEPMGFSWAMHTSLHTFKTEVVVTAIANVAVIVFIKHVLFTVVAVHRPRIEKWGISRDTVNKGAWLMSKGFWIRSHTLTKRGKSDVLSIIGNIAGSSAG